MYFEVTIISFGLMNLQGKAGIDTTRKCTQP